MKLPFNLSINYENTARIILGSIFVIFGLNGFFNFISMPAAEGQEAAFLGALASTGYMFPLLKTLEILAGLALILNRYSKLALVILAPIVVNILAFHVFLAPSGMGMAGLLTALEAYLIYKHRQSLAVLLT